MMSYPHLQRLGSWTTIIEFPILRSLPKCERHLTNDLRGWADDTLVKNLARLFEMLNGKIECHYSNHGGGYGGNSVEFLEIVLP
jgi:hypothetical protein